MSIFISGNPKRLLFLVNINAYLCILLLALTSLHAQRYEKDYQELIHREIGGEKEVHVQSGSVDILTDEYAIEVEFANKWKQAIGQSLWYGLQTHKQPGIVIIKENVSDGKYILQLGSALGYAELSTKIKVWIWPDDFEHRTRNLPDKYQPESTPGSYWLTNSSGIRHNSECRYFESTRGEYCTSTSGEACSICGG